MKPGDVVADRFQLEMHCLRERDLALPEHARTLELARRWLEERA